MLRRIPLLLIISLFSLWLLAGLMTWLTPAQAMSITVNPGDSIQAAIDNAQPGDTILIQPGLYTESLTLSTAVSLTGSHSQTTIIQAEAGQRVLTVTGTAVDHTVIISGLTLANGASTGNGGGILLDNGAAPILQHLILQNNRAAGGGGLYIAANSNLILRQSVISSNHAITYNGGGLWAGGPVTISQTQFINNNAQSYGGGAATKSTNLYDSLFADNQCDTAPLPCSGGGLATDGPALLVNTVFTGNITRGDGAGLWAFGLVTVTNGRFQNNRAINIGPPAIGGGIFTSEPLTISGTQFISNSADVGGGLTTRGVITVQNAIFADNRAASDGGGLYVGNTAIIAQSQFSGNIANNGGALFLDGLTNQITGSVNNNLFLEDIAQSDLGAEVYLQSPGAVSLIHNTLVDRNGNSGAAVIGITGTAQITNNIIAGYAIAIFNNGSGVINEDFNLFYANTITDVSGPVNSPGNSISGQHPQFVDPANGDFRLAAISPALDNALTTGINFDLDGISRPQGPQSDRGAYERPYPTNLSLSLASAAPTPLQLDQPISYTIQFTNADSGMSYQTIITHQIPVTLTQISYDAPVSATVSNGNSYSWALGNLAGGEMGVITVYGRISSTLQSNTTLTLTASINSHGTDVTPDDNNDELTIFVALPHQIYLPLLIKP
ncbi:MAG TPA: hypothetical protein EYH05_06830 [Anaerolineae bacterium]|nr:hypothetical protein [Anaerolineae bacterium]